MQFVHEVSGFHCNISALKYSSLLDSCLLSAGNKIYKIGLNNQTKTISMAQGLITKLELHDNSQSFLLSQYNSSGVFIEKHFYQNPEIADSFIFSKFSERSIDNVAEITFLDSSTAYFSNFRNGSARDLNNLSKVCFSGSCSFTSIEEFSKALINPEKLFIAYYRNEITKSYQSFLFENKQLGNQAQGEDKKKFLNLAVALAVGGIPLLIMILHIFGINLFYVVLVWVLRILLYFFRPPVSIFC